MQAGQTLDQMMRGLPWWVGEWLKKGSEFGVEDRYQQAIAIFDRAYSTIMQWEYVARNVPPENRIDDPGRITFTHHVIVARLHPVDQRRYLRMAQEQELTARELRYAVRDDVLRMSREVKNDGVQAALEHAADRRQPVREDPALPNEEELAESHRLALARIELASFREKYKDLGELQPVLEAIGLVL
jgi:hypothetical protein